MFPLFESICVINGKILNQKWHQIRYQKAYKKYFGKVSQFNLLDQVYIPKEFKKGRVKLKVLYGEKEREIQISFGAKPQKFKVLKKNSTVPIRFFIGRKLVKMHHSAL